MSRDHNTHEKRRREMEKRRKAEEKRVRRQKKKDEPAPEHVEADPDASSESLQSSCAAG